MYKNSDGKLEYPPDHVGRKSYVTVKGYDYSVPKIYCYMASDCRYYLHGDGPTGPVSAMIMRDLEPYRSPLDGSMITSRSEHRNHMRQHGVIERGNEPMRARVEPTLSRMDRVNDIKRAMGKL